MKLSWLVSSLISMLTITVTWGFSTTSVVRSPRSGSWTPPIRNNYPFPKTQQSFVHYYLSSTASSSNQNEPVNGAIISRTALDTDAICKYGIAMGTQLSLVYALFSGMDWLLQQQTLFSKVPMAVNIVGFYVLALKSRIFNPLSNNRPQVKALEVADDDGKDTKMKKRIMPTWTPPGVVFPIVWLLIVGPLRATAAALLYQTTLSYAHPAMMALMVHLSLGDTWNTINNVEQRYGTAVTGVVLVWLSKAYAAYRFSQVVPVAGQLLAVTLLWLTIAATLVTATWRLNPDPHTRRPQSLYPVRGGSAVTSFQWFAQKRTTSTTTTEQK